METQMPDYTDNKDYDVIFTKSPLYQSLVEAGLQEAGSEDVHDNTVSDRDSFQKNSLQWPLTEHKAWLETLWNLCRIMDGKNSLPSMHGMFSDFKRKVLEKLTTSSLLNEEDEFFLHTLQEDQQPHRTKKYEPQKRWCLSLLVVIVICLLCNLEPAYTTLDSWTISVANTLAALCVPFLLYQITAVIFWKCAVVQYGKVLTVVDEFIATVRKTTNVISKAIRFIQESELVVRGFTFVGNMNNSRVLQEHAQGPRLRQCPDLRQHLFVMMKSSFLLFRHSFSQLVRLYPVRLEIAGVMSHCSEIPLTDYPNIIQLDTMNPAEMKTLFDSTDSFSIDILKSMQELNHIHISEFIRRLAACFVEDSKVQWSFSSLKSLLQTMTVELSKIEQELGSHLDAHRRGPLSLALREEKTQDKNKQIFDNHLQQTFMAVHSLELHLLAALYKVQDLGTAMEETLELKKLFSQTIENDVAGTETIVEETSVNQWKTMLKMVQGELTACMSCWEESMRRLDRKCDKELPHLSSPTSVQEETAAKAGIILVSGEEIPVILDEVFEGYSEPQDYLTQQDNYDGLSAKEEAWLRKQKADMKLCLTELKSIIHVRAADWCEREKHAVRRMQNNNSQISAEQDTTLAMRVGQATGSELCGQLDITLNEKSTPVNTLTDEIGFSLNKDCVLNGALPGVTSKSREDNITQTSDNSEIKDRFAPLRIEDEEKNTEIMRNDTLLQDSKESDSKFVNFNSTHEHGMTQEENITKSSDTRESFANVQSCMTPCCKATHLSSREHVNATATGDGQYEQGSKASNSSAFSSTIASMVAFHAKRMPRCEDTFGDSSSSSDDNE